MNMHIHKRFAPPQEVVHLLAQTYTFDPYAKTIPQEYFLVAYCQLVPKMK